MDRASPYRKIRVCLDFLCDNCPIVNANIVNQAVEEGSGLHTSAGANVHIAI